MKELNLTDSQFYVDWDYLTEEDDENRSYCLNTNTIWLVLRFNHVIFDNIPINGYMVFDTGLEFEYSLPENKEDIGELRIPAEYSQFMLVNIHAGAKILSSSLFDEWTDKTNNLNINNYGFNCFLKYSEKRKSSDHLGATDKKETWEYKIVDAIKEYIQTFIPKRDIFEYIMKMRKEYIQNKRKEHEESLLHFTELEEEMNKYVAD